MDALDFFRAILPENGWKCAVRIADDGSRRQYFVETHEKLAQLVHELDRPGGNVYHGCAAYGGEIRQNAKQAAQGWKPTRHREKQDVVAIKAFWLDVDLAPKSRYADAEEAAEGVLGFCQAVGLPAPLFIGSGNGLHCYWPLAAPVGREVWERYASGLKAACDKLGLDAGRERTADCSSILRPPGTHWRKQGAERLVQAGEQTVRLHTLERFESLLAFKNEPRRLASKPAENLKIISGGISGNIGLGDKLLHNQPKDVIDYQQLADNCRQFGQLRASPGTTSEPVWHAALVLLAHCHNGPEAAHKWADPEWHGKIDEYLARVATTGPTTCKHFRDINPDGCKGCPHVVPTPLSTLRPRQPVRDDPDADSDDAGDDDHPRGDSPFAIKDGKLVFLKEANDGNVIYVKLVNSPIRLRCVQVGEIRTAERFYNVEYFLPHHGWRNVEVMARDPQMIATLAAGGINIHESDLFRRWIKEQVDVFNERSPEEIQFEQYGWKGEQTFLYGSRLYGPANIVEAPGSAELRFRNQWLLPRLGGSLAKWKEAVDKLFGAGSEGLSFVVLAAFAAPLVRFTSDSEGGAIIALITRITGTGKSTALAGAYTVWACDRRALSLTTTDTTNSKGVAMATIGNLPVMHDEFTGDPEVTKAFVKLFTEGRDKMRLDRDGQMRHTVGTWQTLLFVASNSSVVDLIDSSVGSDALGHRVLEFPVSSAGDFSPAEADRLRRQLEANAGWAGHIFLEYLVRPDVLAMVRTMVQAVMEDIYKYRDGVFGREHRFWVRTLACVAVAARIVEHLELVSFSPARIMTWALDFFANKEMAVPLSSVEWLATFVNEHTNEMLVVPTAWSHDLLQRKIVSMVPTRTPSKLTIRREEDTGTLYVDWLALKRWLIKREVSPTGFVAELTEAKIVRGMRHRTLGAGTNIVGGQTRCVEVDGKHPKFNGVLREVQNESQADAQ